VPKEVFHEVYGLFREISDAMQVLIGDYEETLFEMGQLPALERVMASFVAKNKVLSPASLEWLGRLQGLISRAFNSRTIVLFVL
jgi:hypothetical protein